MKKLSAQRHIVSRADAGVALITALAILLLISILGTVYVGYMTTELDESNYDVRTMRANDLAEAGIRAATASIAAALKAGNAPQGSYSFTIPLYDARGEAYPQQVEVTLSDECARLNVNHVPREVLEAMGMERNKVRELKSSFPRPDDIGGDRRWLVSPDELVTKQFMTREAYGALETGLLTVYTVDDQFAPVRYLNLNAMPPRALAYVLNLDYPEAEALAQQRPFASWQDLLTKSGKDPSTFNVKPAPETPDVMPEALSFASRCFRLHSRARIAPTNPAARTSGSEVEAVVLVGEDGGINVRYWKRSPWSARDSSANAPAAAANQSPGAKEDAKKEDA